MSPPEGRRAGRRHLFAAWMVAAAVSAHVLPISILAHVPDPFDFKYDYVAAHWLAEGRAPEALDRATSDAIGRTMGAAPGPDRPGAPAQTHPPPAALLMLPLVRLGYRAAAWTWFALSLAAVTVLARLLLGIWRRAPRLPPTRSALPLALALALWPPTLLNFGYGQWSILLATLLAAGWWGYERGRPGAAAGWFAAAIAIKSTPALALGYFAFRARRVVIATAAILAAIIVVALPLTGGLGAWRVFRDSAGPALRIFETGSHNTASVRGIFARLFIASPATIPIVDRPALAHALTAAASLALLAIAVVVTWRARRREPDPPVFAIWACLIPLLNPLSWTHNVLTLLLPAALLARDDEARRTAVGVALVMLTVPINTLERLAGPAFPLSAWRDWTLDLHAAAGLLLFATACRAALRPKIEAPAVSATQLPGPS